MGLLDNYTGIGMSPRPKWRHQNVLSNLHGNMFHEIRRNGYIVLTEATVTSDWNDLAPDLVIFDKEKNPLSIIEITTHKELEAIITKCDELIDRFPNAEYFVYDYEADVFYQYEKEEDLWICSEQEEIRSSYLSRPLQDYLL